MFKQENKGEYYTAERSFDFRGFECLHIEDFNPGVKRVHVRKEKTFLIVYCADEAAPKVVDGMCI